MHLFNKICLPKEMRTTNYVFTQSVLTDGNDIHRYCGRKVPGSMLALSRSLNAILEYGEKIKTVHNTFISECVVILIG